MLALLEHEARCYVLNPLDSRCVTDLYFMITPLDLNIIPALFKFSCSVKPLSATYFGYQLHWFQP